MDVQPVPCDEVDVAPLATLAKGHYTQFEARGIRLFAAHKLPLVVRRALIMDEYNRSPNLFLFSIILVSAQTRHPLA